MDERVMMEWIARVLRPWAEDAPAHIRPLLLLDSYRCHTTARVVDAIIGLGVDLIHIPAGCTCLCQPVDVGINKSFKNMLRNSWEQYLVDNQGAVDVRGRIPSPSREMLSEWIIDSLNGMRIEMVENAWRCRGFSYFDEEINENGVIDGIMAGAAEVEEAFGGGDDFIQHPNDNPDHFEEDGPAFIFNA